MACNPNTKVEIPVQPLSKIGCLVAEAAATPKSPGPLRGLANAFENFPVPSKTFPEFKAYIKGKRVLEPKQRQSLETR